MVLNFYSGNIDVTSHVRRTHYDNLGWLGDLMKYVFYVALAFIRHVKTFKYKELLPSVVFPYDMGLTIHLCHRSNIEKKTP
jgi:hypothetical protein